MHEIYITTFFRFQSVFIGVSRAISAPSYNVYTLFKNQFFTLEIAKYKKSYNAVKKIELNM
jgi:hypothetical protein